MQTKVRKKFFIIAITIILAIVGMIFPTNSLAWSDHHLPTSVGMDWKGSNHYKLANTKNLYCIQRGASLKSNQKNKYHLSAKITIIGNTATYKGKSSTNKYNGAMSYIFSGGSWSKKYGSSAGHYTSRQVAVYKHWNKWLEHADLGLGNYKYGSNSHVHVGKTAKKIINSAEDYAEGKNSTYKPVSVKATKEQITVKETTIDKVIGPFEFTFTGSDEAPLTIYSSENKKISKYELYNSKEENAQKLDKIKSGEPFYIKNNSKYEIEKVKVGFASKTLKTTIYIMSNSHGKQRLAAVKNDTEKAEDEIKVKIEKKDKDIGKLKVQKSDKKTAEKLKGMQFKIQTNKGWLGKTENKYSYNESFKNAKSFKIKDIDGLEIDKLNIDLKYRVWETKTPNAKYILKNQANYDKNLKAVNLTGENWITLKQDGKTTTVKYKNTPENTPEYISISGYVWEDVKGGKLQQYNNLYDSKTEKTVDGITVKLMQKGEPATEIASTKTANGGKYLFSKKVPKGTLDEYYVSFEYSKDYMPVEFSSTDINEIKTNGSRAMGKNGIATTYTGEDSEAEKTYGLSGNLYQNSANTGLFNSSNQTLEYINLGLKPIPTPSKNLEQDISYVKIIMKGYEYNYIYGGTEDKSKVAAPQVSYQKRYVEGYTRAFYPSDVVYSKEHAQDGLKVYVGYRIDIKNETILNSDEYKEVKMHVNSVTDEFDSNRYELSENEKNWTVSGSTATIKEEYLKDIRDGGIDPNGVKTKFIEFSVKHDAIMKILENPDGIKEDFPTNAIATSVHEYQTKVTHVDNNKEVSKWETRYSEPQTKELTAPYLTFKLGEERQISGTVFEDKVVTENGEKLGNGKLDDGENIARNVKVELMDIGSGDNYLEGSKQSNLYKVDKNTKKTSILPAETSTDNNGNFTLSGIVPGHYYLRYTYGDGSQKIYSLKENKEISTLSSKEYKSTIVKSNVAKEALQKGNNLEWYKALEGTNYSVAIDNLNTRKEVNASNENKKMTAYTAETSITLENTSEKNATITFKDDVQQEQGTNSKFNGFNLGVIEQPKNMIKVEKVITNIKMTNAQEQDSFEGNPAKEKLKGVMDLDLGSKNRQGSKDVRIEREENKIYGSNIIITYAIKTTNISDVNYYNNEYYLYGEKDLNKETTIKVNEVTDYLDEILKYESCDKDHKVEVTEDYIGGTSENGVTTRKQYELIITPASGDGIVLYTEKNKERQGEKQNVKTSDTATIIASRGLSQEEDIEMLNTAEVKPENAEPGKDPKDNSKTELTTVRKQVTTGEPDTARLVITPPTGKDVKTVIIYSTIATVSLVVTLAGIIVIKRRV